MKVVIAGASGFIGKLLLDALKSDFPLIALGRAVPAGPSAAAAVSAPEWRSCDLFSLLQTEKALAGADVGIYLVHSMLPRARLTQSTFENCDLLLADNFARAAKSAGLKRIIYLSGLLPASGELSRHLRSRREVELALAGTGIPVTTLRSGLILGAEGSSFQMLYLLVKRLPLMICPAWTRTRTQCIASADVVNLLRFCLVEPKTIGRTYDIGAPEVMTYRDLMRALAEEMGLRRGFMSVPFFSPGLSRLWVQLITGGSKNLVRPLVESLRHEMVVQDSSLMALYGKPLTGVREALRRCLGHIRPTLRSSTQQRIAQLRGRPQVRSIQRLPLPAGRNGAWVAAEYFRWLRSRWSPFLRVDEGGDGVFVLRLVGTRIPMLKLAFSPERSTPDRQLFYIRGGVLSRPDHQSNGRLEFREVLQGTACLAAIHEFRPRLPWPVYKYSQAVVHLWVMRRFRRYLAQLGASSL